MGRTTNGIRIFGSLLVRNHGCIRKMRLRNPHCASTRSSRSNQPRIQIHGRINPCSFSLSNECYNTYLKTEDNPFGLGKTNFEYQTLPFIYHLYLGTELTFKPSVVLLLVPPLFWECIFSCGF